jgi:hypothetical protein
MKKALVAVATIGAVVALRPLLKRMAQKMREHCEQMMRAPCTDHRDATTHAATTPTMSQTTAAQVPDPGEAVATA